MTQIAMFTGFFTSYSVNRWLLKRYKGMQELLYQ
jgi:hypothetical protein